MASILVVDDEPANLDLMEAVLSPLGHTIRLASGAIPALQAVREERPDLILLDLMMPGMTGFEVCQRLQADAATAQIPVILVTAAGLLKPEEQGIIRLVVDIIHKPIVPSEVVSRVEASLEAAQHRQVVDRALAELWTLEADRHAHRQRGLTALLAPADAPDGVPGGGAALLLISAQETVREYYAALCAEHGLPRPRVVRGAEDPGAGGRPPGAVLLDLDLPGGAAIPLLECWRRQAPGVPVLVLAASSGAAAAQQAARLGACGCIVKGLPPEWAVLAIREALGRQEAGRTSGPAPRATDRI